MKIDQIRQLSEEDLAWELNNQRRKLFEMRSQAVTEKPEDQTQKARTKRDVARILTVMKQRELSSESELKQKEDATVKA